MPTHDGRERQHRRSTTARAPNDLVKGNLACSGDTEVVVAGRPSHRIVVKDSWIVHHRKEPQGRVSSDHMCSCNLNRVVPPTLLPRRRRGPNGAVVFVTQWRSHTKEPSTERTHPELLAGCVSRPTQKMLLPSFCMRGLLSTTPWIYTIEKIHIAANRKANTMVTAVSKITQENPS